MRSPTFFAFFLLLSSIKAGATTVVSPDPFTLIQPDGFVFEAVAKGDSKRHWTQTLTGHSIVKVGGTWFFAEGVVQSGRALKASRTVVSEQTLNAPPAQSLRLLPTKNSSSYLEFNNRPMTSRVSAGSGYAVVMERPRGDNSHRNYDGIFPRQIEPDSSARASSSVEKNVTQKVLVILLDFPEKDFHFSVNSFHELMFGENNSSVRDFYLENSYDNFTIAPAEETDITDSGAVNDGMIRVSLLDAYPQKVDDPDTPDENEADDANFGDSALYIKALEAADAHIDFSAFDANEDDSVTPSELSVVFIVAGYENSFGSASAPKPRTWGHAGGFTATEVDGVTINRYTAFGEEHVSQANVDAGVHKQATIGIMAHELGHLTFDLPDLYDINSDNDADTGGSASIGSWGLMASGSWGKTAGQRSGETPLSMIGWSKMSANRQLASVRELDKADNGDFVLTPAAAADNQYLMLNFENYGFATEHFLLENRQLQGFDAGLSSEGLFITHNGVGPNNASANNPVVAVEMPTDGAYAGAEAVWPGDENVTTFDDDSPNGNAQWSFGDSNISVTQIAENGNNIEMTIAGVDRGKQRSHIRHGSGGSGVGCANTRYFSAGALFTNASDVYTSLLGVQVSTNGGTEEFDIFVHEDIDDNNVPGQLLGSASFIPLASKNKTRAFFDYPISMPANSSRFVVVVHKAAAGGAASGSMGNGETNKQDWYSCLNEAPLAGHRMTKLDYTTNHTHILLMATGYTVTPSAEPGGTITQNPPSIIEGGDKAYFGLSANAGYKIGDIGGTCPEGTLTDSQYETGAITADCTVVASFVTRAPGAPTIDRTDVGDGEIILYVNAGGGDAPTNYRASCTDGTNTISGESSSSPITVSGLTNGTAYTCTVITENTFGTSAASAATAAITPEDTVSGFPIWLLYQATQ